jgi:DNA repair exonuclease SbcCD ATPase subunit
MFDQPVIQLVGVNGAGKSSIPVILEETLYNKNSRGVKKADLPNRYLDTKKYFTEVFFDVGEDSYFLRKDVASTSKILLSKNGEDISGHTATQTYKKVEELLGLDFNTFTKLVCQSMLSNLDFLTATDANRKKFLVSLLGLERYAEAEKTIKEATKAAKEELAHTQGVVDTVQSWIKQNSEIGTTQNLVKVSTKPMAEEEKLKQLEVEAATIEVQNREISTNSNWQLKLQALEAQPLQEVLDFNKDELAAVAKERLDAKNNLTVAEKEIKKLRSIRDKCPTCGSPIDIGDTKGILADLLGELEDLESTYSIIDTTYTELTKKQLDYTNYQTYLKSLDEAKSNYDSTKPTQKLELDELQTQIAKYKTDIKNCYDAISKAERHNKEVEIHNAGIELQKKKLIEFSSKLDEATSDLEEISSVVNSLNVLCDAFGSKGLISYKIESMVKVFEDLINQYLVELSDGRFALAFTIEGTKLALKLYDSSQEVDIRSLSSGEFNRVNTATLLAVRKMMTAVSKVDINVLFLDEVVSVLDKDGKDTLVDILLKEHNLNSVVVSHGYTHPLCEKIQVTKTNNISKLER